MAAGDAVIASMESVSVAGLTEMIQVWMVRGLRGKLPHEERWHPLPAAEAAKSLPEGNQPQPEVSQPAPDDTPSETLLALPQGQSSGIDNGNR